MGKQKKERDRNGQCTSMYLNVVIWETFLNWARGPKKHYRTSEGSFSLRNKVVQSWRMRATRFTTSTRWQNEIFGCQRNPCPQYSQVPPQHSYQRHMAGNWPWAQVKVQTAEPLGYDGIKIPYWLHRQANTQWLPSKLHSGLIGKVSTTTLHIGFWSTRTSESWCEQNSDTPSCFLPTKGSSSLNPSNNKWFCTKPSFSEPHILSEISESWHRNLCLYQGVLAIFETMTFWFAIRLFVAPRGQALHWPESSSWPNWGLHEPHFYANLVPSIPPWKASQSL